jgi:DNA invertase Pin-like site-specific DNA recombinase
MAERIVRAGAYYRMSTTDQDDSIERQRSTTLPHAERKGYLVVDQYPDEGIAGDEFAKRFQLQRLLADAKAGKFDVVLVDEVSRLSRQRFTEFVAKVAHPLEEAGVTVDSVAEGPLGWEEVADLIKLTLFQTSASGESKKLSYRVLTGQAALARQGKLLGGVRPYGYQAEHQTITIPGKAPKVVPTRLVPDGYKAEIVRWIFEHYDAGQMSISELCRELNNRGMPPPGRNNRRRNRVPAPSVWTKQAVTAILKNPVYVGCLAWNRTRQGKYHFLAAGKTSKAARPAGKPIPNGRGEWVVVEGTHEPIVDRDMFDRVQDRLRNMRGGKRQATRRGYLLGGLLVCGHCGRGLRGKLTGRRLDYMCQGVDNSGRRVCGFGRVPQDAVVKMLLTVLRREFLKPARLKQLRAVIRRQEEAEAKPDQRAALEAKVATLTTNIEQGRHNLVILPPDMVPGAVETVRGLERERDQLRDQIAHIGQGRRSQELEQHIQAATAALWRIEQTAGTADPTALADTLRSLVEKVEFCWDRRTTATGQTRYVLNGGVIHLRSDGLLPPPDDTTIKANVDCQNNRSAEKVKPTHASVPAAHSRQAPRRAANSSSANRSPLQSGDWAIRPRMLTRRSASWSRSRASPAARAA